MNPDEIKNLLQQAGTLLGMLLFARGLITHDQASAVVTDIGVVVPPLASLASIAWSVIDHWNKKKVDENARIVPPAASGAVKP
jgi:hypothetical protein